jgi:hypothetical protein
MLWEATLAVPYNWWNFQQRQMTGLLIGAWSRLPIEEVCVWIAVTYATAIVFEVVKVWLASERSVRDALLGTVELKNAPTQAQKDTKCPGSRALSLRSDALASGVQPGRRWLPKNRTTSIRCCRPYPKDLKMELPLEVWKDPSASRRKRLYIG